MIKKERHQRNKDTPEGREASELINKFFGGSTDEADRL